MTQSYMTVKSHIFPLLTEQLEQIKLKKTIKLNRVNSNNKFLPSEIVECINEFLHSFQPPIRLERLSLQGNQINELPSNFSNLARSIRLLDLHNNDLTSLPDSIRDFTSLEILDLSSNKLWNLPSISVFGSLKNLKVISLKENKFKYLPPVLGELTNLNLIEVVDNPLILPSIDIIKIYQHQRPDLDWVSELKNYLITNQSLLEYKLQEQHESKIKMNQALPQTPLPAIPPQNPNQPQSQPPTNPPPTIIRSKSITENKSKSSKAARRMGLIIKKPDENSELAQSTPTNSASASANTTMNSIEDNSYQNTSYDTSNITSDFSLPLNMPHSASAAETTFNVGTPPLLNSTTTTATTVPNTQKSSPSLPQSTTVKSSVPSIITPSSNSTLINNSSNASSVSSSNASTLSRPNSSNRSRSNTMKEIDKILEKNDIVDTEHKSGAYFRRLSTLQENPIDETYSPNNQNISSSRSFTNNSSPNNVSGQSFGGNHGQTHIQNQNSISQTKLHDNQRQHLLLVLHTASKDEIQAKSPINIGTGGPRSNSLPSNEVSPSKVASVGKRNSAISIVKVSRKILFSFSELHSSVRRFTGFCVDKKITMKMISFLYTTKSNIDSLVENLEIMEENGNNLEQIMSALHACIGSFRSIMNLLSENFGTFVAKIDVCFVRMLYLTLYGSFNEILNAYRVLVPNNTKFPSFSAPLSNNQANEAKQKLSVNTNVFYDTEDVDEKLYRSIEIATSNAQVVFRELTRAIGKSAIASTTSAPNNPGISHAVATKVKELTNVCMNSVDITKKLKTKLLTIRNNSSQTTKRLFWDDINLFLKAIIQTFSSVKAIMKDLPILNEVRSSMANLTKTTKDVTILLEVSSYKSMSQDTNGGQGQHTNTNPPLLASIPSVSNIFTPTTAHPLSQNSLSLANLSQLSTTSGAPSSRIPYNSSNSTVQSSQPHQISNDENQSNVALPFAFATPHLSPGIGSGNSHGPVTAPAQSTGLYFAKNGMNPFDGLILANRNNEKDDGERMNISFNL